MRQQCQRDMAVPGAKATHLILVESHFAFGFFQAFLDLPTAARHAYQLCQRGLSGTCRTIVSPLARIGEAAPDQDPARPPAFLFLLRQVQPGPFIQAGTFAAFSLTEPHWNRLRASRFLRHRSPTLLARRSRYPGEIGRFFLNSRKRTSRCSVPNIDSKTDAITAHGDLRTGNRQGATCYGISLNT